MNSGSLKTCVIMQPTFLPWSGYFNLISKADHFVFLTDVEFEKGGWHNRNRILIQGKRHWITCPIQRRGLHSKLESINLQPHTNWKRKLLMKMEQSYKRSPFFEDARFVLDLISEIEDLNLVNFNISLIKNIAEKLHLETDFSLSTDLKVSSHRSKRIYDIIKAHNCCRYLSPQGARQYIYEDDLLPQSKVALEFQNFVPREYVQFNSSIFLSHLSIFDIIANIGLKAARRYVLDE